MNDLLKFITCGSVDDGKSTLIGHILYDAKLLFADQKEALYLDSKCGSRDGKIDYSLLLDGLMAEREQGITIDVAYRYFTTEKRSFIVADTPGHEEYTRNMAVGASFADLAVILVDASKGVLIQTRRHTRICDMVGIRHFVFAINKMDLMSYEEETFRKIERQILEMMKNYDYMSLKMIPVSATEGDCITKNSEHMPWYQGESLLSYLESVDVQSAERKKGFVLPVQRVCRPNGKFRGYQGEVSNGSVCVGDAICVYPSMSKAKVKEIYNGDQKVTVAKKGWPVTITLDREIDVSRGNVIVNDYEVFSTSMVRTNLLWMDEEPLVVGKNYYMKIATQKVPCIVKEILYKVDINTGNKESCDILNKNEMACCEIYIDQKIACDKFKNNNDLGAFVLIDRVSHMTSGCGVVVKNAGNSDHLFWQEMDINREIREQHLNQKAMTLWMTGLSGAGKSAIANALEKKLYFQGKHTMLLDGDNIRMGLNSNLGFSKEDRMENIRRIAEVSKLLNDAGIIVITSFISPFRYDRERAKSIIGDSFKEIYISTPIEECERRDVKGLYKKARKGEISNFTGIDSPYEVPENPDVVINTLNHSANECADIIIKELVQ